MSSLAHRTHAFKPRINGDFGKGTPVNRAAVRQTGLTPLKPQVVRTKEVAICPSI